MTKQETITASQTIFQAVAGAVGEVKTIGKDDRNKFDGYDFASIDKFLALVNPIFARHGLFPIVSQREVEFYENTNSKGGKSLWARFFFDVTIYHSTGESLGPTNIMVSVPFNGAQASGSAQSYALKQFLRATLMIPTGDKDDADLNATYEHHAPKQVPPRTVSPDQYVKLRDLAEAAGVDADTVCAKVGAPSLEQFPADKFAAVAKGLQAKIDTQKADPLDGDKIPNFEGAK